MELTDTLQQNSTYLIIMFIMCCIAFIPQIQKVINKSSPAKQIDKLLQFVEKKHFNYLLLSFMLIAAAVRLWKFGIIPAGFNQDGAMGAVDALAIADHGTDRLGMWLPVHFTAWGYGQMSVFLSYLSVPFIALFGLNRFTARAAVVIVSLVALWTVYSLCRIIFGRRVAAAVLAFCAINPWQMMQSRWALDCNMLPHFFLFSLFFLCLGLKKNKRYLYLSMFFFGVTMYTYGVAWYIVPLFLLTACTYLFAKKKLTLKEMGLSAAAYLFIAWPIFAVMIVNFFKLSTIETPFFTIPFFPGSARTTDMLFFSQDFYMQFINNFKSVVNVTILQKPDLPWNTISEYGTVYLFSIPLALTGLAGMAKLMWKPAKGKILVDFKNIAAAGSKNKAEDNAYLYVLVLIWLVVSFMVGLIINNVNVNRINIFFYPLIILCGIGIYMVIHKVRMFIIVISLIFMVAFTGFCSSYFGEHSREIGSAFYDGFGESMEYIKNLDYDRVYVTNWTQSENSWWVSEPLVLFHHQIDALYYQGKAEAYSKTGKKMPSYKECYKYVEIKNLQINPEENAVYIVRDNEVEWFDKDKFDIHNFAYFNAVIPKK